MNKKTSRRITGAVLAVVVIIVVLSFVFLGKSKTYPSNSGANAKGIVVTSTSVSRTSGHYQYNFRVTNNGSKPFTGDAVITLLDKAKSPMGNKLILTEHDLAPIASSVGSVSLSASGVTSFSYKVIPGNGATARFPAQPIAKP
ncbi:MAG: hypothetical protein ACREGA_04205 [Candidatus Saccharimonadales bacterium]